MRTACTHGTGASRTQIHGNTGKRMAGTIHRDNGGTEATTTNILRNLQPVREPHKGWSTCGAWQHRPHRQAMAAGKKKPKEDPGHHSISLGPGANATTEGGSVHPKHNSRSSLSIADPCAISCGCWHGPDRAWEKPWNTPSVRRCRELCDREESDPYGGANRERWMKTGPSRYMPEECGPRHRIALLAWPDTSTRPAAPTWQIFQTVPGTTPPGAGLPLVS